MTPERWQQVDWLFHSALEQPPPARAAFLRQACGADEFLLSEVESLIQSHQESDDFINEPAGDLAAELLNDARIRLEAGQLVGHYRIAALIGVGGMGEVYLAEDLKLGRQIALKLLPAEFTTRLEHVRRFEQEARAASALNHPNILTIYEIERADSLNFIATEYIDGQTLRQHMTGSRLRAQDPASSDLPIDIGQVLEIAIQIASALAAAHSAGIVHRDIKPENIMLRRDGIVKVLDFGLAKLSATQTSGMLVEPSTPTMFTTNPGVVMGTVRYMSPEQAKGLEIDSRTDTWSLGVVLYEMMTGRLPFEGESPSHVIVSILENYPPPMSRYIEVPTELERIVAKTLKKNRDHRYQKASDLALDLKNLKQELETQEHLGRPFQTRRKESALTTREKAAIESVQASRALTLPVNTSTSSAEYLVNTIRNNKKTAALALTLLLVLAATGFGFYKLARRDRSSTAPARAFQSIEFLRLTNSGRVNDAAISPDGRYVVYVAETAGKQSIWLRQVTSSNNIQIVPPTDIEFYGGTFSRSSDYVYYIAKERNNTIGVLYSVPALGGVPSKLIVDVDGPISFSPDGKQLAFVRGSSTGERALMVADADGSNERKLASRTGYDAFSFGGPAWSPDGKIIATGASHSDSSGRYLRIVTVDVGAGSVKTLSAQSWRAIGRISWLENGEGMVFTATDMAPGSTSQLWHLAYPNGEAQRITRDLQDYHGVSITSDATTLVSKQTQTLSSLWVAPNGDADRARSIASQKEDAANNYVYFYRNRFSWTPDGQIIYTTLVNGTPSILLMTAEGTGNKQLTSDSGGNTFPSMSSDGRHIIFVSERTGFSNVWRMDPDGSNQKQLTTGEDESWAWHSPDSRWVVYHSGKQGKRTLWRISIDGGQPEQLTDYSSLGPVVSPDGNWISCYYRLEPKAPWKLGIVPFNGGPPVRSFEVPPNAPFQSLVRWTPDGLSLAYIMNRDGVSNIWIQPLDGRPTKQLTNFNSDRIFWFDWSPDGNQLGVSRGAITSDVVLIKDLRERIN